LRVPNQPRRMTIVGGGREAWSPDPAASPLEGSTHVSKLTASCRCDLGRPLNFTVRCQVLHLPRFFPNRPIILMLLLLAVSACDVLGFDHSTRVAKAVLYSNDKLDNAAVTAAMNARFPGGSKLVDLEVFVKSLGGRCVNSVQGEPLCTIPVRGGFCVANVIFLSITLSPDDSIQHIEAHAGTEAC
jgi:hypothetical protein